MLSISPSKRSKEAIDYFAAHLRPDGGPDLAPGRWLGNGAAALGLQGPVAAETLAGLLLGVAPDCRPLVRNAGDPKRRAGWDLVLSAPKSVSVLWALGEPEIAGAIHAAHQAAVDHALASMDAQWGTTRRGEGGRSKRPARLIVATFSHFTSRALDPQLHDHGLVLNLGLAEDGTWGTLEPKPIFQQQLALGAIYRADLERRLKGLGLETEPDGEGFRLVAVDRELERLFSQRREEINERLEAWGRSSPQAAQAACLATRTAKRSMPLQEARRLWRLRADALVANGCPVQAAPTDGYAPAPG
jgi:conjugative relaxase-like TrwC/TraI family protein